MIYHVCHQISEMTMGQFEFQLFHKNVDSLY